MLFNDVCSFNTVCIQCVVCILCSVYIMLLPGWGVTGPPAVSSTTTTNTKINDTPELSQFFNVC